MCVRRFLIKSALFVSIIISINFSICPASAYAERKSSLADGKKIYMHYCTPCHGMEGDGKGFNAKNLDPRPANHTDSQLMTKRSDDDLFEAINGGGKRVGKSTLMPAWGKTLTKTQVQSLVLYLRKLCKCEEK
jgi:mono/diheme cytochrome c family protein